MWRSRGGRCVGDKDWSPLASRAAPTQKRRDFAAPGKEKKKGKTNPDGGGRRQADGEKQRGGDWCGGGDREARGSAGAGGVDILAALLLWFGRYSGGAGAAAGLWCPALWVETRGPRVFSAADGGRWSGLLSVSVPLFTRFPCWRPRRGPDGVPEGSGQGKRRFHTEEPLTGGAA